MYVNHRQFGGIPHYCKKCGHSVSWEPVDSIARMRYNDNDMLQRPYRRYDLCSHCSTRLTPILEPHNQNVAYVWRMLNEEAAE